MSKIKDTLEKVISSFNTSKYFKPIIDDEKRSATVVASEDSSFIVISKENFIALGDEHPYVGLTITRAISKILAARLRKTTSDMLTIFDALVNAIKG